jgi:hypothetical protein
VARRFPRTRPEPFRQASVAATRPGAAGTAACGSAASPAGRSRGSSRHEAPSGGDSRSVGRAWASCDLHVCEWQRQRYRGRQASVNPPRTGAVASRAYTDTAVPVVNAVLFARPTAWPG